MNSILACFFDSIRDQEIISFFNKNKFYQTEYSSEIWQNYLYKLVNGIYELKQIESVKQSYTYNCTKLYFLYSTNITKIDINSITNLKDILLSSKYIENYVIERKYNFLCVCVYVCVFYIILHIYII